MLLLYVVLFVDLLSDAVLTMHHLLNNRQYVVNTAAAAG